MVIYILRNIYNNKVYVGQTTQHPNKRRDGHLGTAANSTHKNIKVQRAWNKYGPNTFRFEIIEHCTSLEELNQAEIDWAIVFDAHKNGYNIRPCGDNRLATMEAKQNMSRSMKGRPGHPHTPESKRKISLLHKGRKRSEESKRRQSIAQKGRIVSEEAKQHMREAHAHRILPDVHLECVVCGKEIIRKGKVHTQSLKEGHQPVCSPQCRGKAPRTKKYVRTTPRKPKRLPILIPKDPLKYGYADKLPIRLTHESGATAIMYKPSVFVKTVLKPTSEKEYLRLYKRIRKLIYGEWKSIDGWTINE